MKNTKQYVIGWLQYSKKFHTEERGGASRGDFSLSLVMLCYFTWPSLTMLLYIVIWMLTLAGGYIFRISLLKIFFLSHYIFNIFILFFIFKM